MTAYVKPRFRLPGREDGPPPAPPEAVEIQQVRAVIWTADALHADSRSRLYLGLAGREFVLHIDENDLARGARTTFVLGEEANVQEPDGNDPRTPPFAWRNGEHPVYLRLETRGEEPAWLLEWARVEIRFTTGQAVCHEQPALFGLQEGRRLWLGDATGKTVHLSRSTELRPLAADDPAEPAPAPS
ncbi:hypothetical protein [Actinocorallia populi]|uniref:hypothetical protein n=1 Tax=Actinocorallia populi TaxID=2079200 RepID=UPI000D08C81F|nr:hypothetical protein [Actinocorallia populi]